MLKNTLMCYGFVAKLLHWLIAFLIISLLILGFIMVNVQSTYKDLMFFIHKSTGLLILFLVFFRIFWRSINIQPPLLKIPHWQYYLASATIVGLYAVMVFMPLTGILTSTLGGHAISFYNWFTIPPQAHNKDLSEWFAEGHKFIAYGTITLITLHIMGAFYHHFIDRNNILKRMWF